MSDDARTVHAENAVGWDETASWYARRAEDLRELLASGGSTLQPQEHRLLGMLPPLGTWCDLAVHLQCAAGFDTVSLTNAGARRAVGVDIAPELVRNARSLAAQVGAPAEFVCSDVLTLDGLDGQADLVYTGKGAVHWMFDLRAWAGKVAAVLRPGGWFLLFDFHPMMWMFREGDTGLEVNPVSYFAPVVTYHGWSQGHLGGADGVEGGTSPKKLRPWPPSGVIQALLGAGLELKLFHEYPDTLAEQWTAYPRTPHRDRARIASTYAVLARKPDA
ncbi:MULTISPECIES: class I SAM-dependent methyltransferase [Cellulomonas]|uniref:class I SAM-dependent methyltransferase n=1 Tax=Cellulomonas TaxID=1707 RepID=UPI0010A7AA39|nr:MULTISPECIES: class I SAM-dependent methyltransferase [Cellulomonas]